MTSRPPETFHQAKARMNAALAPYGLSVDFSEPWHKPIWDLYIKEHDHYVPVLTQQERYIQTWVKRITLKPQDNRVCFQWDTSPEEIVEWAKAHGVIES